MWWTGIEGIKKFWVGKKKKKKKKKKSEKGARVKGFFRFVVERSQLGTAAHAKIDLASDSRPCPPFYTPPFSHRFETPRIAT